MGRDLSQCNEMCAMGGIVGGISKWDGNDLLRVYRTCHRQVAEGILGKTTILFISIEGKMQIFTYVLFDNGRV